jgi:hypothetical protein
MSNVVHSKQVCPYGPFDKPLEPFNRRLFMTVPFGRRGKTLSEYDCSLMWWQENGLKWCPSMAAAYFPVSGPDFRRTGAVLKKTTGADRPHDYIHKARPEFSANFVRLTHPQHYDQYERRERDFDPHTLLIMEDTFSAIVGAQYANTVALLGTHMTQQVAMQIHRVAGRLDTKQIILCLDPDKPGQEATRRIMINYGNFLPHLLSNTISFSCDPKELNKQEFMRIIQRK